ncbi:MAG: DUF5050 domain-containing protein, partial [Clostridia bacterium]|nr:DUF5050 domain-containing protein [Clostridia bacterium]
MKRLLSLTLILALTLCTLTACSSGGETPKEKGLTDGYWVVESMVMEGTEFSGEDMTGIFGPAESILSMAFTEDGSFDAVLFEDFLKGSYTGTPDALSIDFAGEQVTGVAADATLTLTLADGSFVLKQQEQRPAIFDQNAWVTYRPTFTDAETCAMSSFMAFGQYLVEDNVLYGLTHSASLSGGLAAMPFRMKGDFPEFEESALLDGGGLACYLCKDGDTLYYIQNYERICRVKTDGSGREVLYEGPCDYLQLHEGRLWFTNADYHFVSTDLEGKGLVTVVDKEIYYPYFICSDWLVFQDDADDESLHLYNTTHGVETNITYMPAYNPVLVGSHLYFTDLSEDGYHLCRVDMSDPDTFLFDRSDLPLQEAHFMVDEGFFYGLNNKSVAKEDWQKLTDVGAPIEEVEMYLSLEYNVH